MIGKMSRDQIAETLGVSLASLKRAFRGTRLAFHNYCIANPPLVRQVNSFYEKRGLASTAEAFGLRPKQVEHIIYRYKTHRPRQIRWTDKQIVEAVKMCGLVSFKAQAKYFNRPNAGAGSIKSLHTKRFDRLGGSVNGMCHWYARRFVSIKARYLRPLGNDRKDQPIQFRRLILWVDMEQCLKDETPEFIREAICTMADFQRWIWKSKNPRPLILKMMKERETA